MCCVKIIIMCLFFKNYNDYKSTIFKINNCSCNCVILLYLIAHNIPVD